MALTSSQRKILRQHAQTMSDDLQLGKAGLNQGFLAQMRFLLGCKEIIKIRLGKEIQGHARQELGQQLAQACQAQLVAVLGKTVLLYRPNPQLEDGKRIFCD